MCTCHPRVTPPPPPNSGICSPFSHGWIRVLRTAPHRTALACRVFVCDPINSAAMKVCAEEGDMTTAKLLFVEGRKAAAAMGDRPRDVAEAVVAAAATAALTNTDPVPPGRANKEVEAVYNAALTVRTIRLGKGGGG